MLAKKLTHPMLSLMYISNACFLPLSEAHECLSIYIVYLPTSSGELSPHPHVHPSAVLRDSNSMKATFSVLTVSFTGVLEQSRSLFVSCNVNAVHNV